MSWLVKNWACACFCVSRFCVMLWARRNVAHDFCQLPTL